MAINIIADPDWDEERFRVVRDWCMDVPEVVNISINTPYPGTETWLTEQRRLAIELNGTVTVYDTLDHQIGGFSQQQSYGGSLTFSSQHGVVDVASLPVVSVNGVPPPAADLTPPVYTPPPGDVPSFSSAPEMTTAAPTASGMEADIIGTIEKLADLHSKGILSNEEFTTKKAELLDRI